MRKPFPDLAVESARQQMQLLPNEQTTVSSAPSKKNMSESNYNYLSAKGIMFSHLVLLFIWKGLAKEFQRWLFIGQGYGYSKESFVWSLILAVGIFCLELAAIIINGVQNLWTSHAPVKIQLAALVIGGSFFIEELGLHSSNKQVSHSDSKRTFQAAWMCLHTMRFLLLQAILLCLLSVCVNVSSVSALTTDGTILLALKRHWTSVPSSIASSWNASDSTPCHWVGVQCDNKRRHVVSLNLSDHLISGQMGPEIGNLRQLSTLDLSYNSFSGIIPAELSNCSLIQYLYLDHNNLNGSIPCNLKKLQNLVSFDLSSNSLEGEIPNWLSELPNLEDIIFYFNNFNGSIPSNIGNLTSMVTLSLYNNQLSGVIPESIGNCRNLQNLFLNDNQLVGSLPVSLNNLENLVQLYLGYNNLEGRISFGSSSCRNLTTLDLGFNQFFGSLPDSLGNCSNLNTLNFVDNNLTGTIPSSLGLLTMLQYLDLSENQLSGMIPPELGKCKQMETLDLYENKLEGEIPSELGTLSKLKELKLFTNNLTGEIPISIWKIRSLETILVYENHLSGELPLEMTELRHLKNISLFTNHFSGVIPQNLGINSSLEELDFISNKFTGEIPASLCFGKKLRFLNLGDNQLHGSIPPDIGKCPILRRLKLQRNILTGALPEFAATPHLDHMEINGNEISGPIPSSLGNCNNISWIDLSSNRITGMIPSELGNLGNLMYLNLSHNRLQGSLPLELSNCSQLDKFDVGFNSLNGSIPLNLRKWKRLSTLILRENRFSGGVPAFFSELEMLLELQIGGNLLGGTIPSSIGMLQNLNYALNLSNNGLIGQIPREMGNLVKLEQLDVSMNNLTGSLSAVDDIPSLVAINISYNSFTGPIPELLRKFVDTSPSSFLGNPNLCLPSCPGNCNIKPCPQKSSSSHRKLKILIAILGSLLFTLFLVIAASCVLLSRRSHHHAEVSIQGGPSILFRKVMDATENFKDKYVVGKGAHGIVYKASLGPNNHFAVKKILFSGHKGGSKSMAAELETIGKVRHRNLVKVEDFWVRKDCGLILYRFMENGSLSDVLYGKNAHSTIEWSVRYNIAIGIAHGLAYLHCDCDPIIVHRDIKPENILLDSDMEPHISDFGIAKLVGPSNPSTSSVSIVGTIGYIAPENALSTTTSMESDVYSYGVVLLELITRKKAVGPFLKAETDIVGWVRSVWSNKGDMTEIIDPSLKPELLDSDIRERVMDLLSLALRCTEREPSKRPTMRDIVRQLVATNITSKTGKERCPSY
ncbi:uncharacterized protein [Rutidosis leptorrhynchoides]|uniref:uncharacterized protein n=1 Tax=Rutidosis leptorrhynchoides TaxID=125765 RepID=UPI003A995755